MKTRLMFWLVAAVAAVGVTTTAVALAGASDPNEVLSQDEVSRQVSESSRTTTSEPTRSPSPSPTGTASSEGGATRTLLGEAAQVVAKCDGDLARLESWSPNPGYRVDEVVRGPVAEAYLWIESDIYEDVVVLVRCEDGELVMSELPEPDDHDRDDHDDRHGRDDHDDDDDYDDHSR